MSQDAALRADEVMVRIKKLEGNGPSQPHLGARLMSTSKVEVKCTLKAKIGA